MDVDPEALACWPGEPTPARFLAENLADHFPDAALDDLLVATGLAGVTITVTEVQLRRVGEQFSVSAVLGLADGPLGSSPIAVPISGYDADPVAAAVSATCTWACTFAPLLSAAFSGEEFAEPASDDAAADVAQSDRIDREVMLHGRRFRLLSDSLDRCMSFDGEPDIGGLTRIRASLGGSLTEAVLEAGALPLIASDRPALLGSFVGVLPTTLTPEVKVHGGDWPPSWPALQKSGGFSSAAMGYLLRDLAILVPLEAMDELPPEAVARTLQAIGEHRDQPWQAAGWRGWRAHGGRTKRLSRWALSRLRHRVGPLPHSYERHLRTIGFGAGPGYGLITPYPVEDGLVVADAGCGARWVLRPDGTVWADATTVDGQRVEVARTFTEFYAAWLDSAVCDNGAWVHWDVTACSHAGIFARALADDAMLRPDDDAISCLDAAGSKLEPSHACIEMFSRIGWPESVFA